MGLHHHTRTRAQKLFYIRETALLLKVLLRDVNDVENIVVVDDAFFFGKAHVVGGCLSQRHYNFIHFEFVLSVVVVVVVVVF